ncbi:hypothetical protein MUU53_16960 [Rhizobium lemnae]|uniref:Uncharacterized protein n=1 Tax=Rhizobium lemnae TaxID=1214924 RepID=A0ABV8EF67_9HYPH|nr:hypothetical protein [Rhizobium lemnae]MCJ8509599.1 hypothetical protein [Rhizobium lemnae]
MDKSSSPAAHNAANEQKTKQEDHGVISAGNDAHKRENASEPQAEEVRGTRQEKR